jgi:HPt (histidine-containing phosphotransfer) domain-containing protein
MLFLWVLYFPEKPKGQFGAIRGASFPGRILGNAKMMKHTNMKPIGCLILATALLIGAGGCDECIHRSSTDGMRFEIDGVEYSVEWTRGGAERQGQFELSFLTVTHVDYPMTTYYGQDRGKIIVPMHPDSEKVVAKTETVYFVQDKRIIFEKGYQEHLAQLAESDELQKKLRPKFFVDNQSKYADIIEAIDANDFTLAHRLVHTLRGTAGMIRMNALQNAAAVVEALLKDGMTPNAKQMDLLGIELDNVLNELNSSLDEPAQRDVTKYMNTEQARALFERLSPMLESYNSECVNMLAEIRAVSGAEELARQIEDYDFETAAQTLTGLMKGLD